MNQIVKTFSNKLPWKLRELTTQLSGSVFTILDSFKMFKKIKNSPEKFGELIINLFKIKKNCQMVFLYFYRLLSTTYF